MISMEKPSINKRKNTNCLLEKQHYPFCISCQRTSISVSRFEFTLYLSISSIRVHSPLLPCHWHHHVAYINTENTDAISRVPFAFNANVNFSKCVTSIYFVCLRSHLTLVRFGLVWFWWLLPCSQRHENWWFWQRISRSSSTITTIISVCVCVVRVRWLCNFGWFIFFLFFVEFPDVCLPMLVGKSHKFICPGTYNNGNHSKRNRQQRINHQQLHFSVAHTK